jgi:hypothetical protein
MQNITSMFPGQCGYGEVMNVQLAITWKPTPHTQGRPTPSHHTECSTHCGWAESETQHSTYFVGFEDLTAVVMKMFLRNISAPSSGSACHLLSCRYLAWLILWPWRQTWYVPPKCQLTFNGLHSVIPQKIALFCIYFLGPDRHMHPV